MRRNHDLASLSGHGVLETTDCIKESSVGREKRQKSYSAILSAVFSKYYSPLGKISLASMQSCALYA